MSDVSWWVKWQIKPFLSEVIVVALGPRARWHRGARRGAPGGGDQRPRCLLGGRKSITVG
jgi:hypothetical protein